MRGLLACIPNEIIFFFSNLSRYRQKLRNGFYSFCYSEVSILSIYLINVSLNSGVSQISVLCTAAVSQFRGDWPHTSHALERATRSRLARFLKLSVSTDVTEQPSKNCINAAVPGVSKIYLETLFPRMFKTGKGFLNKN